jgi:hypothetical protein
MMAVAKMMAAEDSSGGWQQQRWQTMAAEDNSTQDWAAAYNGEG